MHWLLSIGVVLCCFLLVYTTSAQICLELGLSEAEQLQWIQAGVTNVFSQITGDSSPLLRYYNGSITATDYTNNPTAYANLMTKYIASVGSLLGCNFTLEVTYALELHRPLSIRVPHFKYYVNILATELQSLRSLSNNTRILIKNALIEAPIIHRTSPCDQQSDSLGEFGVSNLEVMNTFATNLLKVVLVDSDLSFFFNKYQSMISIVCLTSFVDPDYCLN